MNQQQIILVNVPSEEQEITALRHDALVDSFNSSKFRYSRAKAVENAAFAAYHEALLLCGEDEDDAFDLAREKAEKLERIEREYLEAAAPRESALLRIGFDALQCQRAGIRLNSAA